MTGVIEYIVQNYTLILGGTILILLAIIGYYAEKSNFGQGDKEEIKVSNDKKVELPKNQRINQKYTQDKKKGKKQETKEDLLEKNNKLLEENNNLLHDAILSGGISKGQKASIDKKNSDEIVSEKVKAEKARAKKQNSASRFDKEFDALIPKKKLLDDDIFEDIESLSLDKTQKFKFDDIPDLDDVDLPRIKKMSSKKEDIWKK